MNRHEIRRDKDIAKISRRLIREKADLSEIKNSNVKIGYLTSQEEKKTGHGIKTVFADCRLVPDNMQWICHYHFLITVYLPNISEFTDEQLEILLWHELKHIGIDCDSDEEKYFLVPHDIEEFHEIIEKFGLNWSD